VDIFLNQKNSQNIGVQWIFFRIRKIVRTSFNKKDQMGCNGCDDCGGPRSNAVDWATQVTQQNKATDKLSARVTAVPRRRAADLGTL
jgi:hypothetical protein